MHSICTSYLRLGVAMSWRGGHCALWSQSVFNGYILVRPERHWGDTAGVSQEEGPQPRKLVVQASHPGH